jgi:hypothetical protein
MKTKVVVQIPPGYWGAVKRWMQRFKYADALGYPTPKVSVEDGAVTYVTASGMGRYRFVTTPPHELTIEFEGRRNSFRSGSPFVGFQWDGPYPADGWVRVSLRDPFAIPGVSLVLGAKVVEYTTSAPEAPFYKMPSEWIHAPPQA